MHAFSGRLLKAKATCATRGASAAAAHAPLVTVCGSCPCHLCQKQAWEDSLVSGASPYQPSSFAQDGFVHLSSDRSSLIEVANYFFRGEIGDWVVLAINASKLSSEVKFEPAAPVGAKPAAGLPCSAADQLFPHLYGLIDVGAVKQVLPVHRDASGQFINVDFPWNEVS